MNIYVNIYYRRMRFIFFYYRKDKISVTASFIGKDLTQQY